MQETGLVGETGLWRARYWLVLGMIVISYSLCARQTTANPSEVALLVQLVTVAVVFRVARVRPLLQRVAAVVVSVAIAGVVTLSLSGAPGRVLDIVLAVASLVAYLVAPVVIFGHLLRRPRVDGQTIVAAIAAYVLVGMFFTFVFNVLALTTAVPIFGPGAEDSLTSQLFFSFTTLTTTGYGNLVPVGVGAQSAAIAEAITGQLFLVIAVARIVTGWMPRLPTPGGA